MWQFLQSLYFDSVVTWCWIQETESADTKISVLPSSQCFQLPTICDNQSSSLASGLGNGLHIQNTVHSKDVLNVQYGGSIYSVHSVHSSDGINIQYILQ